MKLQAMAKINLSLDVERKRPDGYHDVRMVMQAIEMHDTLEIEKIETPGIVLTTNVSHIPTDSSNLVWKAAELLMKEFQVQEGLRIHLEKFIPAAAGMAGGSTDAAAALKGVNEIFNLGLTEEELKKRAVKIGADVPFCVMGGTALAEGIGEILTKLSPMPECWILIGKPGIDVSTKEAYGELKLDQIAVRPQIDNQIKALENADLEQTASYMENVFQPGIETLHPEVRKIRESMERHGAVKAMMSGSGPTVFGIFKEKEKAEYAKEMLMKEKDAEVVYLTRPCN